jgi:hypothetical protein
MQFQISDLCCCPDNALRRTAASTRPWTVDKKFARNPNPNWYEYYCTEAQSHVLVGKENYFLTADGLLMPARKGQAPPDLRHFKE